MISSLAEHTRKCLKVKYLGRIAYDFQKSRVTGPWDHKASVTAKKVKKMSCLWTYRYVEISRAFLKKITVVLTELTNLPHVNLWYIRLRGNTNPQFHGCGLKHDQNRSHTGGLGIKRGSTFFHEASVTVSCPSLSCNFAYLPYNLS